MIVSTENISEALEPASENKGKIMTVKLTHSRIALYLVLLIVGAGMLTARGDYKPGYYNALDGQKREALKAAAKQSVLKHNTLQYYELPNYWQYSDVYPELVNGLKRWWDMYSDEMYLIQKGVSGKSSFSANKMQREHAVPKSWWKLNGDVEYTPAYSDMWNLYPSDGPANQAKLNYPLGPVNTVSYNNGVTKVGGARTGYGGGSSKVFEPADEYKGDFARAFFYMATVYDDINWVINYMFQKNSYPTLRDWAVDMLLDWARQDKVSQKEIDRNNIVEQYQGNRNPFVDFPELAEYIWGTRKNQVFYIAEQDNSDPTPPITGDPEITSPVNGESLDFGQTAVGHAVNRALQIAGANLTMPLSVRVSGTDKAYFVPEVTSIPAATMNQNLGYLLNITYLPQTEGKHEAKVILYDGGLPDGQTIVVNLKGESLPVPQLTALTAFPATGISDNEYTANWSEATGIADFYVVTRIRYVNGNAEAETYETPSTSYTFTDRDPEIEESYSVQYSRLGILSPASNTVVVNTSGIEEVIDCPPVIYIVSGGIIVTGEGETVSVKVYDVAGICVAELDGAEPGTLVELPAGVYVITTGNNRRPVKAIVP